MTLLDLYITDEQEIIDRLEMTEKILGELSTKEAYFLILEAIDQDLDKIYDSLVELGFLQAYIEEIDHLDRFSIEPEDINVEDGEVEFILKGQAYLRTPDGKDGYLPFEMRILRRSSGFLARKKKYIYGAYEYLED